MKKYEFTEQQVNQILMFLSETPAKYSLGAIQLIQEVCAPIIKPDAEEIKSDAQSMETEIPA